MAIFFSFSSFPSSHIHTCLCKNKRHDFSQEKVPNQTTTTSVHKRAIERKKNVCILFYNISSYWTKYHCLKMKTKDIKKWKKKKTFSEMFNNKFSVLQYFPFLSHEHNVIESIAIENKERKRKKKVIINYFSTFSWIVRDIQFFRSFFIALTRCQKTTLISQSIIMFYYFYIMLNEGKEEEEDVATEMNESCLGWANGINVCYWFICFKAGYLLCNAFYVGLLRL